MQDLIGERIDLFIPQAFVLPQVRAGAIRAYAVTAKARLQSAPEIPTVDEAGTPGLYISTWHGLWAPKGTPKDVIAKLAAAVRDALADPMVRKRLTDLQQEIFSPDQETPESLAAFQTVEIQKWWPIIDAAGIKAN